MRPRPLSPGDRIALIAPSSPFDVKSFESGREVLESAGYRTITGRNAFESTAYLAGSDAQRAEDLIWALEDDTVDAVLCIRGGYGSGRLLAHLPYAALRGSPKIFLGHSDVTFLHLAFCHRMRWITFHGPNLLGISESPHKSHEVLSLLKGEGTFSWPLVDSQILMKGMASGPIVGGNLTCLCHLIGTPFMPDMTGKLLLLEDCGEAPYRIDRMFTQLRLSGTLDRISGLILGQFTNCGPAEEIFPAILQQVRTCRIPVVSGLPFGHGDQNEVMPFGCQFRLDTREKVLRILQRPFSR